MFLIGEPLILVIGHPGRGHPARGSPWLMPLRVLAVATLTFSAAPHLLVVVPARAWGSRPPAAGPYHSLFWLDDIALVLSYGAYVAEVIRAGIESLHPSVAPAEALALSRARRCIRRVAAGAAPRRTAVA